MEYTAVEGTCCYDCAACTLIQGDTIPCAMRRILLTVRGLKDDVDDLKALASKPTELKAEVGVDEIDAASEVEQLSGTMGL